MPKSSRHTRTPIVWRLARKRRAVSIESIEAVSVISIISVCGGMFHSRIASAIDGVRAVVRGLHRRDVEVHRNRLELEARAAPAGEVTAHFVHDAPPERYDQARFLRDVDQQRRVDFAARRMPPAHQRFEAVTGAVLERDDRLEHDPQAGVTRERDAQVGREFGAVDDRWRAARRRTRSRGRRRLLWRGTSRCRHRAARCRRFRAARRPPRCRRWPRGDVRRLRRRIGSANAAQIASPTLQRVGGIGIVVMHEHRELVAADARDEIAVRRRARAAARGCDREIRRPLDGRSGRSRL